MLGSPRTWGFVMLFEIWHTFFSSFWTLIADPSVNIPLNLLLLHWKNVCSNRLVQLKIDWCSLCNPGQSSIGGMIKDHSFTSLRVYSKAKILAWLKSCFKIKLCLSNLNVGGDSVVVISLVSNKERGFWKFNNWLHKFFDVANEVGCFFS